VTVVGVLELRRRDQSDLAVQSSVVEPVDVFGDGDLEVVDVPPRALVPAEFGLEQRVEGLGQGVVVGVAAGADRGDGSGLGEALGVPNGELLDSAVGVVNESVDRLAGVLAGPQAHFQRVEGQVGAQAAGQLPPEDPAGVHVDDEGDVHPAGEGPAVGDVGNPQLIGHGRGERAIDQVGAGGRVGPGTVVRGPLARLIPRSPAARISRATVQRATG
jgi:hypothetical protein